MGLTPTLGQLCRAAGVGHERSRCLSKIFDDLCGLPFGTSRTRPQSRPEYYFHWVSLTFSSHPTHNPPPHLGRSHLTGQAAPSFLNWRPPPARTVVLPAFAGCLCTRDAGQTAMRFFPFQLASSKLPRNWCKQGYSLGDEKLGRLGQIWGGRSKAGENLLWLEQKLAVSSRGDSFVNGASDGLNSGAPQVLGYALRQIYSAARY